MFHGAYDTRDVEITGRTKNQEPNQEPRTKNQEPRTKNQEPRTKNQEPKLQRCAQPLQLLNRRLESLIWSRMTGDDDNIGRLIAGRYRLDQLLGRGGFGSVYRGWDTQIGRDVAVKLLDVASQSRTADQERELKERFRREAMAAGRINHRCVVTIYDIGVPEGEREAYLVMELLDGHDLAEELSTKGPLHPERALSLFVPLIEALGRGHAAGVIHKDIKPQNIFLRGPGTAQESLCLVDFGVARVVHEDKLTLTGLIVGTPQYMAPEYITETLVTPALDVYQMGLLLAETITGVPAVPLGETFVKSCNRHFTGDLEIPPEMYEGPFGAVLKKALAPNPKERYPSAAEFAKALAAVDPATISLDNQKTAVFHRCERAPTFDEPPLFPTMRPEQVSAELERMERDPSAVFHRLNTPHGTLQPTSDPRISIQPGGERPSDVATTETSQPAISVRDSVQPGQAAVRESVPPGPPVVRVPAGWGQQPASAAAAARTEPTGLAAQSDGAVVGASRPSKGGEIDWSWGNAPSEVSDGPDGQLPPPSNVGVGLIAVACVLVIGVVGAAIIAGLKWQEASQAEAAAMPSEPVPEPTPVPSPRVEAPPEIVVEKLGVRVTSEPPGARVLAGSRDFGVTPTTLPTDAAVDSIEVRLDGFETATVAVGEQPIAVTLKQLPNKRAQKQKRPPRKARETLSEEKRAALLQATENANEPTEPTEAPPEEPPEATAEEAAPEEQPRPEKFAPKTPREPAKWKNPPSVLD